jgi:hypothetical protein
LSVEEFWLLLKGIYIRTQKGGCAMLGVLAEGIKKVGDWIEKTFGSPNIDEEIEKLFMENQNEEELENVIMETKENKKDELVKDVGKYENKNDTQRLWNTLESLDFRYGFMGIPYGPSKWFFFFYGIDD